MIIRDAEIGDLSNTLVWRNDPLSCSMFITDKKVDLEEHNKWFKNSLTNPLRTLYIGLTLDKKVGICRFDYDGSTNCSEVSINVNPLMRGRNLSYDFLKNSIKRYLALREKNKCSLTATIKKENKAGTKLFEKCGFKLIDEDDNLYFFILKNDA